MFGRIRSMALAGRVWRRAPWTALVLGFVALGCNADPGPGSDSTTHFWDTCSADAECGSGELCVCGRCSHECDDDDACVGVDVQCVGSLPALKCDPPNNVCAPSSALKVPQEQDPDASIVEVSSSSSAGFETEMDAGISTTASPTSGTPSESIPTLSVAPSSEVAERTDSATVRTDAVPSAAELPVTEDLTPSTETSSEVTAGETGALAPVMTFDEKYATWGMPWTNWNGDKPAPATDCELAEASGDEINCDARWECAEHDYRVSCSQYYLEGAWTCSCAYGTNDTAQSLSSRVVTSDPSTACEAGLAACTTLEADRQCINQPPEIVDDFYSCEWEHQCSYVAEPSGVAVSDSLPARGWCIEDDGHSVCQCDGLDTTRTYLVHDAIGDHACEVAQEVCDSDSQPQTWHHPECVDEVYAEGDSCGVYRTCPLVGEVSSQVDALSALDFSSSCRRTQDGDLECTCSNDLGELTWLDPRSAGIERCFSAVDLCQHSDEIVFDVQSVCGGSSGEVTPDNCRHFVSCTTAGTYRGLALQFTTRVTLICSSLPESDRWSCYCFDGADVTSTELESASSESDVCAQHQPTCLSQLELGLPVVSAP